MRKVVATMSFGIVLQQLFLRIQFNCFYICLFQVICDKVVPVPHCFWWIRTHNTVMGCSRQKYFGCLISRIVEREECVKHRKFFQCFLVLRFFLLVLVDQCRWDDNQIIQQDSLVLDRVLFDNFESFVQLI